MPRWGAVVVAAGSGSRFGGDTPKQFLSLGGRPVVDWSLSVFDGIEEIGEMVVVLPRGFDDSTEGWRPPPGVTPVPGGARRQDSVLAGLRALQRSDMVLIHDGARPFPSPGCVRRVMESAAITGAAIPVVPVRDTVKRAGPSETVAGTVPREDLMLSQTPQGFRLETVIEVLEGADDVTDECAAMEAAGHTVHTVAGDRGNIKITDPDDMHLAAFLTGTAVERRSGTGLDFHPFEEDRPLVLGGLRLEPSGGLAGHSDGDALLHAAADAVLAAARLGDIGEHFPPSDPRWKDADSAVLLGLVMEKVRSAGWEVDQLDATVIGERPRILPLRGELIARLAGLLGTDPANVWVKGTTTNTLGDIGAGRGLGCLVQAVLRRTDPARLTESGFPRC